MEPWRIACEYGRQREGNLRILWLVELETVIYGRWSRNNLNLNAVYNTSVGLLNHYPNEATPQNASVWLPALVAQINGLAEREEFKE